MSLPPAAAPAGPPPAGVWPQIESTLAARHPALVADLRPGASDAELDDAQARLGVVFPAAFREFYKVHDGQTGSSVGLFFGMKFLSLAEVVAYAEHWRTLLADDPATYGAAGYTTCSPEAAIDTRYIHEKWIPFTDSNASNHVGLDFAPGPQGTVGQCITFGRDQSRKFVVGSTFDAFVAWCAARFGKGTSTIVELQGFPPGTYEFSLIPPGAPDMIGMMMWLERR